MQNLNLEFHGQERVDANLPNAHECNLNTLIFNVSKLHQSSPLWISRVQRGKFRQLLQSNSELFSSNRSRNIVLFISKTPLQWIKILRNDPENRKGGSSVLTSRGKCSVINKLKLQLKIRGREDHNTLAETDC